MQVRGWQCCCIVDDADEVFLNVAVTLVKLVALLYCRFVWRRGCGEMWVSDILLTGSVTTAPRMTAPSTVLLTRLITGTNKTIQSAGCDTSCCNVIGGRRKKRQRGWPILANRHNTAVLFNINRENVVAFEENMDCELYSVVQWIDKSDSGIPNMRLFLTPYPQVTCHGTCGVRFWPLIWAEQCILIISTC